MKITHALVVKLVDTKDLKAEGSQVCQSIAVQGVKTSIKSHNFNLAFNKY